MRNDIRGLFYSAQKTKSSKNEVRDVDFGFVDVVARREDISSSKFLLKLI